MHSREIAQPGLIASGNALLSAVLAPFVKGNNASESSTKSGGRNYPRQILEWSDFAARVTAFHELDGINLAVFPINLSDKTVINENVLVSNFLVIICLHYMSVLRDYVGTITRRSQQSSTKIQCYADVVCINNDESKEVFAVGELKTFWNLDRMPLFASEISRIYSQMQLTQDDSELELLHRKWCVCVAQTNGYMMDQQVKYGFVSCFNLTWFLMACEDSVVRISCAYACDSGEFFRAFAYFMHTARRDGANVYPGSVIVKDKRQRSPGYDDRDEDGDGEAGGGNKRRRPDSNSYKTRSSSDPSSSSYSSSSSSSSSFNNGNGMSMAASPAADAVLSLRNCDDIECIGAGRMGIVLRCTYAGQRTAIKLVDINKGDLTALDREKSMYKKLQSVQGVLIPKVIHYNCESPSGLMVGFAMQELSHLPSEFEEWDSNLRAKAYDCLHRLAEEVGIVHNDIRPCNFGLAGGDQVLIFDLEDVTETSKTDKRYLNSLKKLLL